MRFPVTLTSILVPIFLSHPASAHLAHVYTSDPVEASDSPVDTTFTPSTARLLLAQRLGITRFHPLEDANDDALRALNTHGGRQRPLFDAEDDEARRRQVVLLLEGVSEVTDDTERPSFRIKDPPRATANAQLFDDIISQFEAVNRDTWQSDVCPRFDSSYLDRHAGLVTESKVDTGCLTVIRGKTIGNIPTATKNPSHFILKNYLKAARDSNADLTAIFIEAEPENTSGGIFRRSSAAPASSWGGYSLPSKRSPQSLGGLVEDIKDALASNAEDNKESDKAASRPTIEDDSKDSGSSHTKADGDGDNDKDGDDKDDDDEKPSATASSTPSPTSTADTTPPRGILPACYPSLSDCASMTHHCSGHGNCTLRYDLSKHKDIKCYACACTATVRDVPGGGKKTTRWAGPACQKKDVSEAFWLLAGFTVVLVGVVTWAIGLLYSMGAEDLPSVIGAGVAGPRAK